jgi:predicted dehydrogenase
MKTDVALIGAGAVAERHARVLSALDDVEIVAVADPEVGRAPRLADAYGARAYADHESMLAAEDVDAVYVCVPPFAHGEPERAVLAAGLPMFVEKPLAGDLATAVEIAARVERAGVVTATGYHWRCLDTVQAARELLDGHPARLVQASWLDKVPPPAWWLRHELSGGQLVEQTTHTLDLMRVLAGEVVEVFAVGARTEWSDRPDADIDDVTAAALRFASGAVGSVVSSCLPAAKHRAGVEIVADGLVLELSETELVVSAGDGREVRRPQIDAKVQVDRDFIDAVRGGPDRSRAPYREALRTHALACALTRSSRTGRTVRIADVAGAQQRLTGRGPGVLG